MTVEQLERGQQLLKDIEEYEWRLKCAENGLICIKYNGSEINLDEDIFNELISAQIKKDLDFLKEGFESL